LLKRSSLANTTGATIGCLPEAKYRVSIRRSLQSQRRSLLPRSSLVAATFGSCMVVVSCFSLLGMLDVFAVAFEKISQIKLVVRVVVVNDVGFKRKCAMWSLRGLLLIEGFLCSSLGQTDF